MACRHALGLNALSEFACEGPHAPWGVAFCPGEDDLLPAASRVVVADDDARVEYRLHVPERDAPRLERVDGRGELLGQRVGVTQLLLHGEVVGFRGHRDLKSHRPDR
ncbi:MAG: hypothetical protein K0S37_3322 [Microbacterium sp.]|nr:hypothetical protein [Microbacterium sp.]